MFFYFSVPNLDPLLCMSRTCNSESFHSEDRILHEVNKYTQVIAQKKSTNSKRRSSKNVHD